MGGADAALLKSVLAMIYNSQADNSIRYSHLTIGSLCGGGGGDLSIGCLARCLSESAASKGQQSDKTVKHGSCCEFLKALVE